MEDQIRVYLQTSYPNVKIESIKKGLPTFVPNEDGQRIQTADPILYHVHILFNGKPHVFSISESKEMKSQIEIKMRERNIPAKKLEK